MKFKINESDMGNKLNNFIQNSLRDIIEDWKLNSTKVNQKAITNFNKLEEICKTKYRKGEITKSEATKFIKLIATYKATVTEQKR